VNKNLASQGHALRRLTTLGIFANAEVKADTALGCVLEEKYRKRAALNKALSS